MKHFLSILLLSGWMITLTACGGSGSESAKSPKLKGSYNPELGVGTFTKVSLNATLNPKMIDKGRMIFNQKCVACHKLNSQRLVGPGLKGITKKHNPVWIMNYLTNTETMIDMDPSLQKLIHNGYTRMPDQNLSAGDARSLLELFRQNDKGK